jgi:penicillin amidase
MVRRTFLSWLFLAACSGSSSPQGVSDATVSDVPHGDVTIAPDAKPSQRCWRLPAAGRAPAAYRLSAPVEVIRDTLGIPHLYGATDADVMYAAGYVQAVDRLFQMDLMRRSARGTLAAVLGREKLAQDRLVRLMEVARWGFESSERVRREDPALHRLIEAWVAGVNRRVAEVASGAVPRPAGFAASEYDFVPEPWTVDDPFLVGELIMFQNANQLEHDLLASVVASLYEGPWREIPLASSFGDAFVLPPDERPGAPRMARRVPRGNRSVRDTETIVRSRSIDGRSVRDALAKLLDATAAFPRGASNNWALAGRHTFNGRPLLAGDPHQPVLSPSVLWAHHMNSAARGGSFDVIGFSFVGAPGVHLGHNRRVAWTATTAYPDTMDLWRVEFDGEQVSYGGRLLPVARCEETFAVAGAAPVTFTAERVEGVGVLLPTDFTPLPVTSGSERLLYRWVGFRPTADAQVFFGIDRARSLDDFDASVRRAEIALFNFIGADAQGIAYRAAALIPDRGDPATAPPSNLILDGADVRSLWTDRFLPIDRLPHSRGGARGFLLSANNDPFGFTRDNRTDNDPFYYGTWFDPGSRASRIERELTRLTARGRVTVEDLQTLQLDTYNLLADEVIPVLTEAMGRVATEPSLAPYRGDASLAALHAQLVAWDRRMEPDSSAAVVFEAYQHFLARAVLADDVPLLFDLVIAREPVYILKLSAQTLTRRFPQADRYLQGGRDLLALRALAETRDWLRTRFGGTEPSRYRWSEYHRTRIGTMFARPGPFEAGTSPTAGSIGTVNVSQAQFFDGQMPRMHHEARSGAVYRMVIAFEEDGTPRAVVNFPRGNSGVPGSPFFANTHADWLAGRYQLLPFTRPAVEAAMRERTTLMP